MRETRAATIAILGRLRRRAGGLAAAGDARLTRVTYEPAASDGLTSTSQPRDPADPSPTRDPRDLDAGEPAS